MECVFDSLQMYYLMTVIVAGDPAPVVDAARVVDFFAPAPVAAVPVLFGFPLALAVALRFPPVAIALSGVDAAPVLAGAVPVD